MARCSTAFFSNGMDLAVLQSFAILCNFSTVRAETVTEQSREWHLKQVQRGIYDPKRQYQRPELTRACLAQEQNDLELIRVNWKVKHGVWWTTCNWKMCTMMQRGSMMGIYTNRELLGGCWKLYFLPGRIPSEFWPRLDPCCPSACPAHALHSYLDANIPVKWRKTKLGPLLFLDSFYQAANTVYL